VRRHAKASSATSTTRRARDLGRLRALAVALAALCLLAILSSSASAAANPEYLGSFGPDGTEATDFEGLALVATDEATGTVYVGDSKKQVLYKFDSEGNPLDWGGSAGYITDNEITGVSFGESDNEGAVDPQTHVLYVTTSSGVRAFEANGEPHKFIAGPGSETSEIPIVEVRGVAVDVTGRIYVSSEPEFYSRIHIYSSAGALITEFKPEEKNRAAIRARQLAVDPDGTLYVRGSFTDDKPLRFEPSQFPVNSTTTYTLGEEPLDDNPSMSLAVDPTTSYVYVAQTYTPAGSQSSHRRIRVFDENASVVGSLGGEGEDGELEGYESYLPGVAVNGANERVYALDLGTASTPHPQVKVYETFSIPPLPPTIRATSVVDLDIRAATLRGEINPNTLATTYHFEYGLEDCAASACTSVPLADAAIGAGHKDVSVSQEIVGLEAGTTYHYRVVAENAEGVTEGPDKTFTTPRTGLGFSLADSRAWEMVSPPNKSGGRILHYNQGVVQAAANGDGVAYQIVTSIEADPEGNRAIDSSTVLSRRDATGAWSSKDVTPPQTEITPLRFGSVYKLFSTDLKSALLEPQDGTPLSPEASEETPYLRVNTEPGTYQPLVTGKEGFANVPSGTVFGGHGGSARSPVAVRAANGDLTHVVLRSRAPLTSAAAPESLYEWSEGQLQAVSKLPGGEVVAAEAGSGIGSVQHAISEDGTRVFWLGALGLYVRDSESEETGRLNVPEEGVSVEGASAPFFQAASADGSVVFFADTRRLTADASAPGSLDRDLYRCEVGTLEGGGLGCTSLTDISAPLEGSEEKAEVLGIAPAFSDDGTRAYFLARGVLDTEPDEAGNTAVAGEPNLYLWEEGQGRRLIATLSERDRGDWGLGVAAGRSNSTGQTSKLSAAASPDGRYFAFMSERSLTGYDNRDAKSKEPLEEVFRYDAQADHLDCVSCNPSGASPEGKVSDPTASSPPEVEPQSVWAQRWVAAILPTPQESEPNNGLAFRRPRVVLDNGRVFFNAIDALVSADSNGEWDVYQYEPTGTGDCTSSSEGAAIARSAGGCVSLISSGTAEEEASFLDASESGDDVFFLTPARLSATDEDFELDVYDARVDGIPATLPVINECLGEACQPPPNPPNDPTPASAAFHGSGNVPSERCPQSKRKVIRAGSAKCVAKKHKKKKHSRKAKRAANSRRAGR
jgi:hypothetical protein